MEKELKNINSKDSSDIWLPRLHERHCRCVWLGQNDQGNCFSGKFLCITVIHLPYETVNPLKKISGKC